MRLLRTVAIVVMVGFGAGLITFSPSFPLRFQSSAPSPGVPVPIVPLMALYDTRSSNPDGSGVFSMSYLVAVRKDGFRAMISTDRFGKGWLKTRMLYDPVGRTDLEIHDDLGIKTTWPGQPNDLKSIITSACSQLTGGQTIEVLGHNAVQDWHFTDTGDDHLTVLDGWRIPELGCLRALTTIHGGKKDGSYARKGDDRLVWLSETDPPESLFEVSAQLEEVSPGEQFQRYIKAGLFSESEPVPGAWKQNEVAYSYFHGKIDRPKAVTSMEEIDANQVPGQP